MAPSSPSAASARRAVGLAAQRRLGPHERVVAHVEAEHLLLEGQPVALVELEVGDLGAVVEGHAAGLGGVAEEGHDAHVDLAAAGRRSCR